MSSSKGPVGPTGVPLGRPGPVGPAGVPLGRPGPVGPFGVPSDQTWRMPWPEANNPGDVDEPEGPIGPLRFELDGTRFSVTPTGDDTPALRGRFVVWCLTCSTLLHGGCLRPSLIIWDHLRAAHEERTADD